MARYDDDNQARSDMTPMIDAVFLLIIFFLCIDFRTLEAKLTAYLPEHAGPSRRHDVQEFLAVQILVSDAGAKRHRPPHTTGTWVDPHTGETNESPYSMVGRRIRWNVGPMTFTDPDRMLAKLSRLRADRTTWALRADTGLPGPMPVIIEPLIDVRYADVTRTVDIVQAAGFEEISFGAGTARNR